MSEVELAKIISPLLMAEDGVPLSSQASLFLARDLTGKEVVLKRTTCRSREQLSSAQNEVSLLRKIRHSNVVAFYGAWVTPLHPGTEINLLMELCPGGHLLDLQRRREQSLRPLTELEIIRLFVQACKGVECLHRFDPPVAHRDVKLENLLLGGEDGRVVKLCDFGSATTRRTLVVTKEERNKLEDEVLRLTTPAYRAPELVDYYSRMLVSEQVDVWALGCVLFALTFKTHAFGNEGSSLGILSGKFVIPKEPYTSKEFKLMVYWLLERDPNLRPRIGDVVDELDLLLGNKVKVTADKRGSGSGMNRSSCKLACLDPPAPAAATTTATRKPPTTTTTPAAAPSVLRGSAFLPPVVGSTPSSTSTTMNGLPKRGQPKPASAATDQPNCSTSNNPFDDEFPSQNPTYWSNPGLVSGTTMEDDFERVQPPGQWFNSSLSTLASSTTSLFATTATTTPTANGPSQAPIFFSDPPAQFRKQ